MTTRPQAVSRELEHVPRKYKAMYARACAGTSGKRELLRVVCLHCCNWQREQVKDCTGYTCPMWEYR